MLRGEAVFVPDDIPRRGRLALWGDGGEDSLELVFPGARTAFASGRFARRS